MVATWVVVDSWENRNRVARKGVALGRKDVSGQFGVCSSEGEWKSGSSTS